MGVYMYVSMCVCICVYMCVHYYRLVIKYHHPNFQANLQTFGYQTINKTNKQIKKLFAVIGG